MNPLYLSVAQRAKHRCEYCRAPEAIFNFLFEVDHIIPRSLGGSDEQVNLALACHSCNKYKSNWLTAIDPVTEIEVPLFNPRRAAWQDHFELNYETGSISGLTATGRATVKRLRIDGTVQIEARKGWLKLELF